MKYRIAGYGGAHDEAGARIEDETGKVVLWTPELEANRPECWKAYHDNNYMILTALNEHQPMKDALKLVWEVLPSAIPEPGAPHDEACEAVKECLGIKVGVPG